MSDTMTNMELRFADHLLANQLTEGDLIKVNNNYYTIKTISETKLGYDLVLLDDFDDEVEHFVFDGEKIPWYVFVE